MDQLAFATYVSDKEDLYWAAVLAESIRSFAGRFGRAPIDLYLIDPDEDLKQAASEKFGPFEVTIYNSPTPKAAKRFPYAGKAFASAQAERNAEGKAAILAWLDPDTVFVREPGHFILPDKITFGYRPVMHKLIGSLFAEPPDEFWSRLYQKLRVNSEHIFPVTAPVDGKIIRAYFNAGILVVRPERGLLRRWPDAFGELYADPFFVEQCQGDQRKMIFLHQAALAGGLLRTISREETIELPDTYNYPFFWLIEELPPDRRKKSLDEVITFRHDMWFSDPANVSKLIDDSRIYEWLKARMPKEKL